MHPFQALRYTTQAGPLDQLATQPYDKISPAMQSRYLSLSPYNFVRIILGERRPSDNEAENVYTRSAGYLKDWQAQGILARDTEPAVFPYFQEFTMPDTGERLVRKGFVGLGPVEEYSAGVVYRHEQTLTGPKKDRLELLRHTHAHLEQLFLLYPDSEGAVDALLEEMAAAAPLAEVTDEYGAVHRMWRAPEYRRLQALMEGRKLLIADGHHRYETALAFRRENPGRPGADRVMMTFVSMHSPGLRILAAHRLVNGIAADGLPDEFLRAAALDFQVAEIDSPERLRQRWKECGERTVIGAAIGNRLYLLEQRDARDELDITVLHQRLIGKALGIGEEAVRDEKHLRYVRGMDSAIEEARRGTAQIAFLLRPVSVQQVARISFGGGVMPQKSTDFYPKLLSGLTIYQL